MNSNAPRFNHRLALLIVPSFLVLISAVILRVGIGATPYTTTDSLGRPMGFNDPLHLEHYGIIVRNFNPAELFNTEYAYEWVLFVAEIVGAGILLSSGRVSSKIARWYFAAQAAIFPLAVPALFLWPSYVASLLGSGLDREGFIDIPFIWIIAQPVWVITSLLIALVLLKPRCFGYGHVAHSALASGSDAPKPA